MFRSHEFEILDEPLDVGERGPTDQTPDDGGRRSGGEGQPEEIDQAVIDRAVIEELAERDNGPGRSGVRRMLAATTLVGLIAALAILARAPAGEQAGPAGEMPRPVQRSTPTIERTPAPASARSAPSRPRQSRTPIGERAPARTPRVTHRPPALPTLPRRGGVPPVLAPPEPSGRAPEFL